MNLNKPYKATWDIAIPPSLREPFDAPGRPKAHGEFDRIWDYILGNVPLEDVRWKRFNDYYINCIRNVDRSSLQHTAPADRTAHCGRHVT